jgi:small subunit ribosomal protein S21
MIFINIDKSDKLDNLDKALKKLKFKFQKTGVVKELRERKEFNKKSVKKRQEKLKAIYINQKNQETQD